MPTDAARARAAGDLINEAQGYVVRALRALRGARDALHGTAIEYVDREIHDPSERSLTGRDISISTTELEGVLLRLKHGTPR